ncbi:MAG: ribosome-binding factor A [Candidatus Cloacimonadota bacterium]|nr:MAG: ribosome-binding factor A [Candidatus Cloacimonadota bacterium]PIE77489.1 MAG: ribosome-binding factor A [Candidatus Delongbacteria bacterium]
MANSKRQNRISEEIRKKVSNMLLLEMDIPEFKFVTISSVKISPDLSYCTIFYNIMERGPYSKNEIERLFTINRKRIRQNLSKKLNIKMTPELKFIYDDTLDKAMVIESLLKGLNNKES